MVRSFVVVFSVACCLFTTHSGLGISAEPWADPRLTVKDRLQLWLDASHAAPTAIPDGKLAVWHDGSGHRRNVVQPITDAQPTRQTLGNLAIVRFDGIDDCMRAVKQNLKGESFSLFAVVVPRANPSSFRGFFASNANNQRDYESGINIDFGPAGTPKMSYVNIEGAGFGGIHNFKQGDASFGRVSTFEVMSDASEKKVRFAFNGKSEGSRPRTGKPISLDEITIGARFYNNAPGNQKADGFLRCEIAEILVYDRALSNDETAAVRSYLNAKYASLNDRLPPDATLGNLLIPVKNPPPVQMFVPGFTVREIPVNLTNINNVKYRPDGTLVAMGYDGNMWLLRDTDGDGLEDRVEQFYKNSGSLRSPIGMDLTLPHSPHGQGVYTSSEGKVVLIVDSKGTGKADREIIVADGWKNRSVNIDVIGVAVDPKDGSVWFGRGTPNFANGYLLDQNGKTQFSLSDERGTIQRVSPDFKTREVIATGIRFPVGMRFNRRGDLFCSDQEGATWLPNGNPLDELLHVQKGRHYGFPPRHPTHLPNVIDEPSTFDYGPQHQSTCGINFNMPVKEGGPTFGPADWADDVFVTGYSRGKLYRTKLVHTNAGYIAKSSLFACLNMLTVDACVAPDGSLVVACHSGGPDWGSGPTGKGKLFKITYSDPQQPQPVLIHPAGPREIRVAFDKPLDPLHLQDLAKQATVTAGKYVRAGDRFESLWPGYAVVHAEKVTPRIDIPIRSVQLSPDRRTLSLMTDPLTAAVHYAVTLPGLGRPAENAMPKGTLRQVPQIDLDFDLSGVLATWKSQDGQSWSGWLPTADLRVAKAFTVGSAEHEKLWTLLEKPGELTIDAKLNLDQMLRPAVQPGASIDFTYPKETVSLTVQSSADATLQVTGSEFQTKKVVDTATKIILAGTPKPASLTAVKAEFHAKGSKTQPLQTSLSYGTNEDSHTRPFPLHRSFVPWADRSANLLESAEMKVPAELEGGSWALGRKEFFGDQAGCAKCHTIHGRGESIGPDLSNLIFRDYASVMRDIAQPSFAINPDHLTYVISLKDGRTLTGAIHSDGKMLRIGDTKGAITTVSKDDVESMKPSAVSTMPEGLPQLIGPERMKHLMTFLLTNPVSMPRDGVGPRPKPRTRAEINAALAGAPAKPEAIRPLKLLLVAGPKDHGPGEHDYPAWQKAWKELLAAADQTTVTTAWDWPTKDDFARADVMIFFQHGNWDEKRAADIDAFLARGGGLVYLHWAVDGQKNGKDFAKRIGLSGMGAVGFRHGDLVLSTNRDARHPVMRNIDNLALTDETYWNMAGDLKPERILATAVEENKPRPQLWSLEHERGRVFVSIPGHYSWTFDDPLFRIVLLRGIAWSAKEPVDRFNELVWPGANVAK
ncbi:MAG: ThuA domain-containing protein [Gemmataceae bacterium]